MPYSDNLIEELEYLKDMHDINANAYRAILIVGSKIVSANNDKNVTPSLVKNYNNKDKARNKKMMKRFLELTGSENKHINTAKKMIEDEFDELPIIPSHLIYFLDILLKPLIEDDIRIAIYSVLNSETRLPARTTKKDKEIFYRFAPLFF